MGDSHGDIFRDCVFLHYALQVRGFSALGFFFKTVCHLVMNRWTQGVRGWLFSKNGPKRGLARTPSIGGRVGIAS